MSLYTDGAMRIQWGATRTLTFAACSFFVITGFVLVRKSHDRRRTVRWRLRVEAESRQLGEQALQQGLAVALDCLDA